MKPGLRALLAAASLWVGCGGAVAAPPFLQGPYVDVTQGLKPDSGRGAKVLIWAFATGDCRQERWVEGDSAAFIRQQVMAFSAAGQGYIVSTGGEAAGFFCEQESDLAAFVARHDSPQLLGLDFDIEREQTPAQIGALVRGAAALQRKRPGLRISFTLATHGSADGSKRSLNATGELVMAALAAARFDAAIINLMVMNYGPADARWCVLKTGGGGTGGGGAGSTCDMGASALQAARNVAARYGWPISQIALTPMLGENDVAGNVFTLADAQTVVSGARALGLAGVHWWSVGRDRPCPEGSPRVSPTCHSVPGLVPGQFGTLLGAVATRP